MNGHAFAIRDLKISVGASDLTHKEDITRELELLSEQRNSQPSKRILYFSGRALMRDLQVPDHDLQLKVGKSIDAVKTFDDFAVETRAHRRRTGA